MQCPYCNYKESKVVDSRHTDSNSIRRRRECESCFPVWSASSPIGFALRLAFIIYHTRFLAESIEKK